MRPRLSAHPEVDTWQRGFHEDHLFESSFLTDVCNAWREDAELSWTDASGPEERLDAHLAALASGGRLALDVCVERAAEGDAGELYAAVCTFCRQADGDRLDAVLDDLDTGDEERARAVADALCDEAPPAWRERVAALLDHSDPALQAVAARVLGDRRWEAPAGALTAVLDSPDDALVEAAAWALGRLPGPSARSPLCRLLQHDAPAVCAAAATALLRLGDPNTIQVCARRAEHAAGPDPDGSSWALLPLALAGGPSHGKVLRDAAAADDAPPDALLALGLGGDPSAVDLLLYHLGTDELAKAAAAALHLLTGAGLTETVFVPEDIDEDELFEDELEAFRRGELPTHPRGAPYGTEVTRLAQEADTWRDWWTEAGGRFVAGTRYRLGTPYGPEALVAALAGIALPQRLRPAVMDELAIRYGVDTGLEPRLRVSHQQDALRTAAQELRSLPQHLRSAPYVFAQRVHR